MRNYAVVSLGCLGLCLLAFSLPASSAGSNGEVTGVEHVVRKFWTGFDDGKFIDSVDFPLTIVEVTEHGSGTHFVRSRQDIDTEIKRIRERGKTPTPLKATPAAFKVQMLNPQLATVSYRLHVPHRRVGSRTFAEQTLPMTTILEKKKGWRIIFSTYPEQS